MALGACATSGTEGHVGLTAAAPDGGASEPVHEAAEVDAGRLLRIGAATEAVGDLENAITMYQRALALAPDSVEALLALADAYRRAGAPENAAKAYRGVLEREPANLAARRGLGNALVALGRSEEALAEFDLLVAAEPLDERGHNGRGVALSLLGRHEEARQAYESGLRLAPADLELNNNLATLLLLSGEPEQAIAILDRIVKQPGAPERVRQNLARAEKAIVDRGVRVSTLEPPTEAAAPSDEAGVLYQLTEGNDEAANPEAGPPSAPEANAGPQVAELIKSPETLIEPDGSPAAATSSNTDDSTTPSVDEKAEVPATADAAPQAEQKEEAAPSTSDGPSAVYRVQLSAEQSRELALERWAELQAEVPDLLGAFSPHISKAPDTGKGTFYRLRTNPRLSQAEAQTLCDALSDRSIPCYVAGARKDPTPATREAAEESGTAAPTSGHVVPVRSDAPTAGPWSSQTL
ncbi:MAG: tetratricopeptide repeat protein [Alphaproteobacteria bacterium]